MKPQRTRELQYDGRKYSKTATEHKKQHYQYQCVFSVLINLCGTCVHCQCVLCCVGGRLLCSLCCAVMLPGLFMLRLLLPVECRGFCEIVALCCSGNLQPKQASQIKPLPA